MPGPVPVKFGKAQRINVYLRCSTTKFCRDVLGKHLRVAARDIDIQILIVLEFVQQIVNGDFVPSIVGIRNRIAELDFVDKQIILFTAVLYLRFHVFGKDYRVPELRELALVQFKHNDVLCPGAIFQQVVVKKMEQERRFSTTPDTCNDLDLAIPHVIDNLF